ncbi:MAG: hypothetical protein M3522_03050 [Actinomycetota bacterium]|jgi:hypothetical protein|nr:hypothetical protein [Actinomycetota bacterium]
MFERLGSSNDLLLAVVFAAIVVVLSTIGPGIAALVFTVLPLAGLVIALYFVVRWAVAAGVRDAGGGSGRSPDGEGDVGRAVCAG